MYSTRIIERNISRQPKPVIRYLTTIVASWVAHLDTLIDKEGKLKRPLRREEKDFISNAVILSKLDFVWWAENFCTIELDAMEGGGLGKLRPWESQRILLNHIAKLEEECYAAHTREEQPDGVLVVDHKGGRQLGHTALARALTLHRMLFRKHTRALAGSLDDEKIHDLYRKDKLILDNLPWWMRPSMRFDVKDGHIDVADTGSTLLYQVASQKGGVGQGGQFDATHITELAFFEGVVGGNPIRLELEFFPTLPQSRYTLCLLETTANGRGNWWHGFSERARLGRMHRWSYCFVPWYAEPRKYRRTPPVQWQPKPSSLAHAKYVYNTSPEFTGGRAVTLAKENLYWWETARDEALEGGTLNIHLTNFAATPEESFQHSGRSAFDASLISELHVETSVPAAYEIVGV